MVRVRRPGRLYDECSYAAASWAQPWRVIIKAEVMAAGDNPRFVVTSLAAPTPQRLYEDLYCARGNCENDIKAVKCDLRSDRTSATTFLANATRLLLGVCGVCPAPCLAHAHPRTYRARPGPTRHRDCDPLQSGNTDQTVQRPDPAPPAQFLPGAIPPAPGHGPAVRRPRPCLEHVLRRLPASDERGCCPVPRILYATHRRQRRGRVVHGKIPPGGVVRPVAGATTSWPSQKRALSGYDRSKIFFNTLAQGRTPPQNRQSYGL